MSRPGFRATCNGFCNVQGHFHLSHNYMRSISVAGNCAFVQTGVIGDCNRDGFRHSRVLKGAAHPPEQPFGVQLLSVACGLQLGPPRASGTAGSSKVQPTPQNRPIWRHPCTTQAPTITDISATAVLSEAAALRALCRALPATSLLTTQGVQGAARRAAVHSALPD